MVENRQTQGQAQTQQPLKSAEFVKSLSLFFQRDLISLPLVKRFSLQRTLQQCHLKGALLEFDIAAFPNIDYIAGNRLSVYPINPADHVNSILRHIQDDIYVDDLKSSNRFKKAKLSEPWARFVQLNGKQSIRLALTYIYDIRSPPSRDLLRVMADCCSNKDERSRLISLSKSDEVWEKWVCKTLRTLKSTFDDFSSCMISAKSLFSELTLQQPRQYSISSIKSSKRFRTEILVIQHKFSSRQIASTMQVLKEREAEENSGQQNNDQPHLSPDPNQSQIQPIRPTTRMNPTTAMVHDDGGQTQMRSAASIRSIRSIATFGPSPITTQQVKRVPSFSGPLMSLYASSTSGLTSSTSKTSLDKRSNRERKSQISMAHRASDMSSSNSSVEKLFDGLASNYLLNLNPGDLILCEFVENPRFTLKGNRERPIMMIGQDVGLVAFRSFWQQRALEHDRAQMFYTLFKDLSPKKFGEMHLVCLTGGRCKIEDLFKRDIQSVITHKILTSTQSLNRKQLNNLLDNTASLTDTNDNRSQSSLTNHGSLNGLWEKGQQAPQIAMSKELIELGTRIARLLVENNGCIYTCCDPHLTQAIEILVVESVIRLYGKNLTRAQVMSLLLRWKGKKVPIERPVANIVSANKFVFTLENLFESAQMVQEIYDSTI